MATKKKNKSIAQRVLANEQRAQKVKRVGTYYKEVRNSEKSEKVQNNFKLVPKVKAMRLIAGIAYTKYSKFFTKGILKLVTDYVGR